MLPAARHLTWQSPPGAALLRDAPAARATGRFGAVVAVAIFLPVWLPRPLAIGDFSLAFAVPLTLALWALTRPAWPGSLARALFGTDRRGLLLELLCAVAIATLAAMTMLYSPEPLRAFRVILPMSYGICTLILLARVPLPLRRRLVLAALYAGALMLGIALVLAQTGAGRDMVMRDYRFLAFFENPNQLGVAFLAVWPLAIALLLNARTARLRLFHALVVLVLIATLVMSGTKTALALGFVSGALIWLYHGSRSGSIGATLVRLVGILCAIVLAVPFILWLLSWASPGFFQRVNSILTNGVWQFPSMQTRDEIWKESLQIGLAHPLLGEGAGVGVYGYAHSHNMFLDYFRGMGVFALAAAVALVLGTISRGANFLVSTWQKGQADRSADTIVGGMYLGAIGYLIGNMISDSFSPTTSFLFWMMYFGAYLTTRPKIVVLPARPDRLPSTTAWRSRADRRAVPEAVAQPI